MLRKTLVGLLLATLFGVLAAQDSLSKQGRIDAIDMRNRVMVVDGKTYELHSELLRVEVGGKPADAEELEVGMKVRISVQTYSDAQPDAVVRVSADKPKPR